MADMGIHRMEEIASRHTTWADKMRALDDAGFKRTEIAQFLGKRYQHVRNVLNRSGRVLGTGRPRSTELATDERPAPKAKIQIGAGGRVVIPAEIRAAMGVRDGDTLSGRVVDGELRLLSKEVAVRKAQDLVRQFIPEGVSLVDELIDERRHEAARETEK
jgi:AbrB family looped-hinge helix DNA binding protein